MKEYKVRVYSKEDFDDWNTFVSSAKNATFLFDRRFMEYHSDRFLDYSLMIFDENRLVAILPVNRVEDAVFSHDGLTYGGLVLGEKAKLSSTIFIFKSILKFLDENSIQKLTIKMIPKFYNSSFADEIDYCMFLLNAKLVAAGSLETINLTQKYEITKKRRESIRRGHKNGLVIKEESRFDIFWNEILIPNLNSKFAVNPVHSLEEIIKLHAAFPENIRHFNVYHEDKLVAGTTVFITKTTAHPQYISSNATKNKLGSLDFLYHYLITEIFTDKKYFDFGPSNEELGRKINKGLLFWKESFGAKTVVQFSYELKTNNYKVLDSVLK